jgi:mannose-6-phosphate isomerase-like protein (cupin superfamily)
MDIARVEHRTPFVTKDGSEIRELAGLPTGNAANQSLAHATVAPRTSTDAHYHPVAEEIYLFVSGTGRMLLGDEQSAVRAGDCVVIPPGTEHQLVNDDAREPLVLFCCCSPPYTHADTVITRPAGPAD